MKGPNLHNAESIESYIRDSGVQGLLKECIVRLCVSQPSNPIKFIRDYFEDLYQQQQQQEHKKEQKGQGEKQVQERKEEKPQRQLQQKHQQKKQYQQQKHQQQSRQISRRDAICGKSISEQEAMENYTKKVVPKDYNTMGALSAAFSKVPLFTRLKESDRSDIFDAMFPLSYPKDKVIFRQGDEADNFYIIGDGQVDIIVNGDCVSTLHTGQCFGELALINNVPRAATVQAKTDVELWGIDNDTYRRILMANTIKQRKKYVGFLSKVPILQSLNEYERMVLADALESVTFADKEIVVRQGEPGNAFYIIEHGEAEVIQKLPDSDKEVQLRVLKKADYFGEVALLLARPRVATVKAHGQLVCARLDRDCFERLMGPCREFLKRNMKQYTSCISLAV